MAYNLARQPPDLIPGPASMPIVLRNQAASPLLSLPNEIRNRIYELVLDLGSGRILHRDHNDWDRQNFTYVCHQIYAETARAYSKQKLEPLEKNGVYFRRFDDVEGLIAKLTPSQKDRIESVFLHGSWNGKFGCEHTGRFAKLRNLMDITESLFDPGMSGINENGNAACLLE